MSDAPVFLGYSQADLDAQYNNRAHVPNHAELYASWVSANEAVIQDFKNTQNVPYGTRPREILDVFVPDGDGPFPIQVFFHGGYWMSRDKEHSHFLGRGILEAGAIWITVEYTLIPDVTIAELCEECSRALEWVHAHAAEFNGDPNRIHISGHSAGGHIAAWLTTVDWSARNLPADVIKSAMAISGIFDLEPIRLGFMQETLGFTPDDVARLSPLDLKPSHPIQVQVAVGGAETEEFRRQSKAFAAKWQDHGMETEYIETPGSNHFTVLEDYAEGPILHKMVSVMIS